jgi:antitoxin component YwqK of YwqJK toxin-antitoxin module
MRTCLLLILAIVGNTIRAQEPDYLRDLTLQQLENLQKTAQQKESLKKPAHPDSTVPNTYAGAEDDKIIYMGEQGFPEVLKSKLVYFIEGWEKNGKRTGLFKYRAVDSKNVNKWTLVKELTFVNDTLHGPFRYYYPDSILAQEGQYVRGSFHGKAVIYYPDGKVYNVCYFENGALNGTLEQFFRDGNPKLKMGVKNDQPHGEFITYYPGGTKMELITYVDGKGHGKYQYYHPNGQLWVEKEFRNEKLWNIIVNYDSKGRKKDKGTIKDGNGTVNFYNENGKLYLVEYYENGEKVKAEKK